MAARPIRCLFIANRGEIACRIQRTAQAMGMRTVAAYTEGEEDAAHVRMADAAVQLHGSTPTAAYLDVAGVVAAALRAGADAVHPGYGFLSERDAFAQAVLDAGLIWVGPPPEAMRALGGKAQAKRLAMANAVPCLPGYSDDDQADETLQAAAQAMGYPIMIKAVAGGGGRGMRLVREPSEWAAALASARSEASTAFGCADVLLERALLNPRHIELQVVADAHGHAIHLGERECSLQRRHQKVFEEAPSPVVDAALRTRMGEAAVRLAQAAGYVGVGTVEFLADIPGDGGDAAFYFMEMNTRLQVEHPVTEAITGIDLVAWQLKVAQGEPLPLSQDQVRWSGHAIEARLCAEDDAFLPRTGTLADVVTPALHAGLRLEHAMDLGGVVSPYFDSMIGKWIGIGADRAEAMRHLEQALSQTAVLGLPTNRAVLTRILAQPDVRAADINIAWLQAHAQDLLADTQRQSEAARVMAALLVDVQGRSQGHRMGLPYARPLTWLHGEQRLQGQWQMTGPAQHHVVVDGHSFSVSLRASHAEGRRGQLRARWTTAGDGLSHEGELRWARGDDGAWHAQFMSGPYAGVECSLHDQAMVSQASGASRGGDGVTRAPCNGKVLRCLVKPGDAVKAKDTLLVIESMKLEHSVYASADGVVGQVAVSEGQQVSPGQVLVQMQAREAATTE